MTLKERILEAITALPDDAGLEDIIERLTFMLSVEQGLAQVDAGAVLSQRQIRERVARWLE